MSHSTFGEYIKDLRLAKRMSLRSFAEQLQMDPANYSKMERGKLAPPRDEAKLEPFRKLLGINADSLEWREALRLASLQRGEVPARILSNEQLMAKLPALFRTLEGDPIDETLLEELIATLRREYKSNVELST